MRTIRVFLASPGDVAAERAIILKVLDKLNYDPLLKDQARLEPVAWDHLGTRTPMVATKTPQQAIIDGMTLPSECDLVVVIFWSRMGTPLDVDTHGTKPDGTPYLSGTEWEYLDALAAAEACGAPQVVVYRRTEKVLLDPDAADFDERHHQYNLVKAFFAAFRTPAGAFKRGFNEYPTPDQFETDFEHDLRFLINELLKRPAAPRPAAPPALAHWPGSPFPGLRAFTPADAPIFFGRSREVAALVKRVLSHRFVAVVGASGSGKSSLVGAGLIPRLETLEDSQTWLLPGWRSASESGEWTGLRFTPGELGDNPFLALAARLAPLMGDTPREVAATLAADPSQIASLCEQAAHSRRRAEVLLFIDQFEELFTVVGGSYRGAFVDLLRAAHASSAARVVVTMRSDFYHRCVDYPPLAALLEEGSFPLSVPTDTLLEMITRPAERAGLTFDEGLPGRILKDTGDEPGALALMAYTLDELYHACQTSRALTHAAYDDLGGVEKAIGTRAEKTFAGLKIAGPDAVLQRVFHELVEVDERGTATRRRTALASLMSDPACAELVTAFTEARLLVTDERGSEATVEVAHEALFRSWGKLAEWIQRMQDDLRLMRQFERDARDWQQRERPAGLQPKHEQLIYFEAALRHLNIERDQLDPLLRAYTEPEQERLLREVNDLPSTADRHGRRRDIGDRLSVIGDPRSGVGLDANGLPQIDWLPVTPGGDIKIGGKRFTVKPFYIAKYLVTYAQYQAFVKAEDGFENPAWWEGMPKEYRRQELKEQLILSLNNPRDNVSWYQAVAYTRWLSARPPLAPAILRIWLLSARTTPRLNTCTFSRKWRVTPSQRLLVFFTHWYSFLRFIWFTFVLW